MHVSTAGSVHVSTAGGVHMRCGWEALFVRCLCFAMLCVYFAMLCVVWRVSCAVACGCVSCFCRFGSDFACWRGAAYHHGLTTYERGWSRPDNTFPSMVSAIVVASAKSRFSQPLWYEPNEPPCGCRPLRYVQVRPMQRSMLLLFVAVITGFSGSFSGPASFPAHV